MASFQMSNADSLTRAEARRHAWFRVHEGVMPYLFVAPLLILMGIFIYYPLVYSFYLSFFDWNFVSPEKLYIGFDNYTRLWDDPHFHQALRGTLFYTVTLVPLQVFLPLALALLLWPIRKSRAQNAYRVMLFSPTIIAYSVAAVMWLWIFNANQGILNKLLAHLDVEKIRWLSDRDYAIWVIVVVATWKSLGFHLLLYLAALEGVPKDIVEAAQLDGAGSWEVMKSIRFPLITPTFFFVMITTVMSVNDDVFGAINVLTNGGPFESTTNVIYFLYLEGFRTFQVGAGSAVAVLIFVVTALLTWLQFRFIEGRVHYG